MTVADARAGSSSEVPRSNERPRQLTHSLTPNPLWAPGSFRPNARPHPGSNFAIGTADDRDAIAWRTRIEPQVEHEARSRIVEPVVFQLPAGAPSLGSFIALQRWEGVVLDVDEQRFVARLEDRTADRPAEEAEFPLEEVSRSDIELVQPGAVFYWSVGYLDRRSGQRLRESIIKFRRLPAWTERAEVASAFAGDESAGPKAGPRRRVRLAWVHG